MSIAADVVSVASAPLLSNGRDRSGSTLSNDLRPVKSGSAFGKTSSLKPPDGKKSKKSRRLSASSKNGIAAALAKGGLALAHGHTHTADGEPILGVGSVKSAPSSRRGSRRNPYLKSSHRPDGEGSDAALEFDDDEDDEDEDFDSDIESGLPVTGFAVASNRRNAEFHQMFPSVDEGDYLIEGKLLLPHLRELKLTPRLWMCIVERYTSTGTIVCLRESYLFSCQYLWLDYRCESPFIGCGTC